MSSNLITPVDVGPTGGPGAWLRHIGRSIASWPVHYYNQMQRRPLRASLLSALVVLAIAYPYLNRNFFAGFSRTTFPLPLPDDTTMVFMLIFAIMAVGLNIVIGFAGLLDLGYVAFYALGAYTAAYLASPHWAGVSIHLFSNLPAGFPGIHMPFVIVILAAAVVAAVFGVLLGAPTLRLRGDYLAIVTLGFGEIVPVVFKNLVNVDFEFGPIKLVNANLTGGPLGINPIDAPNILGIRFGVIDDIRPVYLAFVILVISIVIARNLERSRMGRAWMAIREDETAAEMMGVNTVRTKLLAFGLGASFAGFAGALQASYQGATTSDFFMFATSIIVVVMIILGGVGNIWGVILGALVVQFVDKTLLAWIGARLGDLGRIIDVPELGAVNPSRFSFLIFGIALVLMMRFRPEGFLPSRQRAAELHTAPPDQAIGSAALLDEQLTEEEMILPAIAEEAEARAEEAAEAEDAEPESGPPREGG